MISAYFTATSGTLGYENKLDVTSNNLANANTTGYKSQRADFTELLYTNMQSGSKTAQNLQVGHGVKLSEATKELTQGNLQQTGEDLDYAISGEGFFALEDAAGNTVYTRSGNFSLSNENDTSYLVTTDGKFVLDADGEKIEIPIATSDSENSEDTDEETILPGVYTFKNPYALNLASNGIFSANEVSGEGEAVEEPTIKQGFLEGSNVSVITQMQNMIESQRGFQLNARVIQTADEMEQMANSLRP